MKFNLQNTYEKGKGFSLYLLPHLSFDKFVFAKKNQYYIVFAFLFWIAEFSFKKLKNVKE